MTTPQPPLVLRTDDPRYADLTTSGWSVLARSFGALLIADDIDHARLTALVDRTPDGVHLRDLDGDDVDAVLALDARTVADHPGGPATRHDPLDATSASSPSARSVDEEWVTLQHP